MLTPGQIIETAIEAGVATWDGEPMCRHGHVVTGVNVSWDRDRPRCRTCKRDRQREYMARKRARG